MIVLCYGAGTNTTAMIVGLAARNITPDLIVMADTGLEVIIYMIIPKVDLLVVCMEVCY